MSSARRAATTLAGVGTLTMAPPFSACVGAIDETDDGFEGHFHLKSGGARLFAARLHLRIICNCSSNGIGELAGQPVDDVIH